MQTKLSVFCDRLIEAGWLAAAIVAPLFFNFYSNRIFEASKVTLLRSIVLLMLGPWLIKSLETWPSNREQGAQGNGQKSLAFLRTPLVIPALFLMAVYVLTTITSVIPRVSFWGSYHRREGTYVVLCYVAIFFLTLQTLRTRQQLERLITVILLTSLPISLYGIMQHYELDPLPWIRGGADRVQSTFGNPILMGAYLIMVIPVTGGRLLHCLRRIQTEGGKLLLVGCYLLVLGLQLTCLLFTQSRGPVMGLLAGLFFFFLLLAIFSGQKGLVLTVVGFAILLVLFLVILNLPNSPLAPIRGMPYIGRLGRMLETASGTGRERVLTWQGAMELVAADPLRAVIGHGPDSMYVAFNPYLSAELADSFGPGRTADRCHNETLDALAMTGLVGFAAYLLLFGSTFYHGLKGLGLIRNRRHAAAFVLLSLAGGSLGTLIPWLLEGTLKFAGVGLPLGLMAAMGVYLVAHVFFSGHRATDGWRQILLVALLSALVAHFIEIQFGIAIAATRTYFWLYAALLVIVGYFLQTEPTSIQAMAESADATSRKRRARRRKARRKRAKRPARGLGSIPLSGSTLSYSLAMGLILMTIGFDFIIPRFDFRANGPLIFGLFFAVWLLGGLIVTAEVGREKVSSQGGGPSPLLTYCVISLGWLLLFIIVHAAIAIPGTGIERVIIVYYLYHLLAVLAIAASLVMGFTLSLPLCRGRTWWLYPIIAVGVIFLVLTTNLNVAKADIYYKFGLAAESSQRIDEAIAIYRRAVELAPHVHRYHLSLGWAYGLKAMSTSDASQQLALFEYSCKELERAKEINPLDPDIMATLGHVYWNWGRLTPYLPQQAQRWEVALVHYRQATALSPQNQGRRLKDNMVQTYRHLGDVYTATGKLDQAIVAYKEAIEMASDDYLSHRNLAIVYQQLGLIKEAIIEAKAARELAPAEEGAELDSLIAQLEMQKP